MGYELLVRYGLWVVLILSVAGLIWWGSSTIHDNIYNDGRNAERVIWQEDEAKKAAARAAKIKELTAEIKRLTEAHAQRIAGIDAQHSQEIEDAHNQKQLDIAAARAGTLKLQWNTKNERHGDGGNAPSDIAATAAICNDQTRGELPAEITANLFALADDADLNTMQLAACQAIVESDRANQRQKKE